MKAPTWRWRSVARVTGAVLTLASAGMSLGAVASAPAHAATRPTVVYSIDNSNGYTHPSVKPRTGSVMQGTLQMSGMRWGSWHTAKAVTKRATIHEGTYKTAGKVTLFDRKLHKGHGYFAKMTVHENNCHPAGCAPTDYCLQFTRDGSRIPQWNEIPGGCPATAAAGRALARAVHPLWLTGQHSAGCRWQARGKHEFITYAYLRMIKDTCAKWKLRIRIAGKCSVAGWRDGNWIDKVHQLTSISCPAGQGYFTIVYDYQWYWPKSAKDRHGHARGKVHQVTLQ